MFTAAKIRILSDIFTIFASWTTLNGIVIKRAIKIFWRTTVAVATFLAAAALTIQLPQIQTFVAEKFTERLSDRLDGDITFEKLHFKPFTTLILKNVNIIDRNPASDPLDISHEKVDTFFTADYIIARLTLEGIIKHEGIHIDKVFISNAQMNLVLEDKEDEGDGDTSTDNLSRIFRIKQKDTPKKSEKEIFKIRKVEISDMGFSMKSYSWDRPIYEAGIDWNDMDIKNIHLNATDLQFKAGIMSGEVKNLSFREKTGYQVEQMSGSARVGRGKTIVENLHIDDLWSDVRMPLFMMSYENIHAFNDFISKVRIDGDIAESTLDFETLSYFAPQLKGNRLKATVSGSMSGPVDDFIFSDIRIDMLPGGFSTHASGRMKGLPDIDRTYLDADLTGLRFTTKGIGNFISGWMMGKGELDLSGVAPGARFSGKVHASGMLNDLDIKTSISSNVGSLKADMNVTDAINPDKAIGLDGTVGTRDLDIGAFAGTELIGPTTMNAGIKAKIGNKNIPSAIQIDSLKIEGLEANGYDYSNIAAIGKLTNHSFDGKIVCHDPNLNFMFQGTFALSPKTNNARYKFYANIGHADLHAMNIDKRGVSKVNLMASADFTKAGNGNISGKVDIGGLTLENKSGREDIGDISLNSYSSNDLYIIRLDSGFANGSYSGSAPISTFVSDLKDALLKKELPAMFADSSYIWKGNDYELNFRCSNSMDLLSFIMPGLYIDEGTTLAASLDKDGTFSTQLTSNRIAFGRQYIKGVNAYLDNRDDRISGSLESEEIMVASRTILDNRLTLLADDNRMGMKFSFDNHSELENRGELILNGILSRDSQGAGLEIDVLPSAVYLNGKEWGFLPSEINLTKDEVDIPGFTLASGEERIRLEGKMSQSRKDTLTLSLDRFDISIVNSLIGKKMGISGAASGNMHLISPLKDKGILADIICDSTSIADVQLGELHLRSEWDEEMQNFGLYANTSHAGRNTLNIIGTLAPEGNVLDADVTMDGFRIDYAQPFLTDVFSEMKGEVSGRIRLEGPLSDISISSTDTRLDDATLRVAYTNVPYHATGRFHLNDSGVYFDDIRLKDNYTGTGEISGSINWDRFRDMRFNTHIKVQEIQGINLKEGQGEGFYGTVYGTGNVSITGPMNSLVLSVEAVTAKPGQLHIPLSDISGAAKTTNLLRFKQKDTLIHIDPYEKLIAKIEKEENSESNFDVKLRINAQPDVTVFVELDKSNNNVLSGNGSGLIDLEVGEDVFSINGDYTLSGGNYRFVAMGLVSRDFQIQSGSSILFNGEIMESTLNIDAVYRTKASLSTLLTDVSSVTSKRNVDCMLSITDKLSNPRLGFGIDIPDLNPMIKSRVESALSTEDKVQRQFLSLIVSNNFLPDEQSGIVNNTSALYSNVTEMLANQLNNIFQKLDIPIDLGLNYQPNEQGNDLFDVAVSTQLFNNRVIVNGNIGNKQYTTGSTQNDVVGDLDIEIKLNRSGAFRLNLFSHSADQFSNYLDDSQRNGVGLMYQTEFNSFRRFIRTLFMKKAKRQEEKLREEQAMLEGGKVELNITKEKDNE